MDEEITIEELLLANEMEYVFENIGSWGIKPNSYAFFVVAAYNWCIRKDRVKTKTERVRKINKIRNTAMKLHDLINDDENLLRFTVASSNDCDIKLISSIITFINALDYIIEEASGSNLKCFIIRLIYFLTITVWGQKRGSYPTKIIAHTARFVFKNESIDGRRVRKIIEDYEGEKNKYLEEKAEILQKK